MYKKLLYKHAYRSLKDLTPLKFDCGLLCEKKCCSGSTNEGMILFPDEEKTYADLLDSLDIQKRAFEGIEVSFATCNGSCKRNIRPLSCMIYPLFPYVDIDGVLSIIEDPRAKYICPILFHAEELKTDRFFIRKMYRVFRLLMQDAEIYNHMRQISTIIDEYAKFTGLVRLR